MALAQVPVCEPGWRTGTVLTAPLSSVPSCPLSPPVLCPLLPSVPSCPPSPPALRPLLSSVPSCPPSPSAFRPLLSSGLPCPPAPPVLRPPSPPVLSPLQASGRARAPVLSRETEGRRSVPHPGDGGHVAVSWASRIRGVGALLATAVGTARSQVEMRVAGGAWPGRGEPVASEGGVSAFQSACW